MRAGSLRHRITIRRLVDGQDDEFGSATLTPTVFADRVPASVEPLTGKELINADRTEAGVSHRVRIRYMPGIVPKMQVVFNERILNIVSVINKEERNIELELMCLEKVQ
jgi:SPP1 family predicted phage head-tail adaptor